MAQPLATDVVLGYEISTLPLTKCLIIMEGWLAERARVPKYFVCANPHSLYTALRDPSFDRAIRCADLVIPDGVGVVIASRMHRGKIRGRITGADIFEGVSGRARNNPIRYFFLGSTPENLDKLAKLVTARFPCVHVCGSYSPLFGADVDGLDGQRAIHAINQAQPDVVWVGMTAPKQEKWILQHREQCNVAFMGPIGAVFDFFTGRVRRPNAIFRALGLEWLPRFLAEPRRLWRRNFVSSPMFLMRSLAHDIARFFK